MQASICVVAFNCIFVCAWALKRLRSDVTVFVWWEMIVRVRWRTTSARSLFVCCLLSPCFLWRAYLSVCLFVFLFIPLSLMFSPFFNMIMQSKGTPGTGLGAGRKTLNFAERIKQPLCMLPLCWSIGCCVLVAFRHGTDFSINVFNYFYIREPTQKSKLCTGWKKNETWADQCLCGLTCCWAKFCMFMWRF